MFERVSEKIVVMKAEAIVRDAERLYPQRPHGQRLTAGWFVVGACFGAMGFVESGKIEDPVILKKLQSEDEAL